MTARILGLLGSTGGREHDKTRQYLEACKMSEIRLIEPGDADESLDLQKAKEVAQILERTYSSHPWLISFQGRALVVRHLAISDLVRNELGRDGFGFVLKHLESYSSSDLAKNAITAGGQMLEAFGLPRAAWKGEGPIVPAGWKRKQPGTFN